MVLFLTIAFGLAAGSFAFENQGLKIENADEVADYDLQIPPDDMLGASEAADTLSLSR